MLTLSDYFPKDTEYFYSYPIGDTLYHFNSGNPADEELISARLLACAGENVKMIIYNSSVKDNLLEWLEKNSDIPFIQGGQILILPEAINEEITGSERNELITEALTKLTSRGKFMMAQPILDERLKNNYQIDPNLSTWLNDKKNLDQYVPAEFLPERYAAFLNGKDFFESKIEVPLPCVVKVSSSSTGDGVRLCSNMDDLKEAKNTFKNLRGTIFIEKLVSYIHNIGFQFGIPYNETNLFPPHIIGYNHQVTTAKGEFLGGFIFQNEWDKKIDKVKSFIETEILPKIRAMGWYGIGGLDVLIDQNGKFYIIDSNFRTTGMTAYIFLTRNNLISKSMVSFSATFKGTEKEFSKKILSLNRGKKKILTIISLSKKDDEYRFNSALLFDKKEDLPHIARELLAATGIKSAALEMLEINC